MSTPFAITAASNSLFLDAERTGEATFTVSNQSGRAIEGRARLVVEEAEAEAETEAEAWVRLRGAAQRTFAIAGTEQYTAVIEVPEEAPGGSYTLRLDMVGEERPDEQYVEGPQVTFEVPEAEAEGGPFPWKVAAAVAAVLVIGGGGFAYDYFFGPDPPETGIVPAVAGLSPRQASEALMAAGFPAWKHREEHNDSVSLGRVIGTIPGARAEVATDRIIVVLESLGPPGGGSDDGAEGKGGLIRARLNQSKCLHKKQGNWSNGNPIHLWGCDAGVAEFKHWIYETETGYIRSAENPEKCLHKDRNDWENGNPVHLWDCDAGAARFKSWQYDAGTGYIRSAENPEKCLHKDRDDWENGNPVHLWDCDAGVARFKTWRIESTVSRLVTGS